ncbi:uncharacterized protein TNCV_3498601 [Trichonephila clavipes]|nr:uncharacterized protein TNCV_3498601 [Trichonephila clavipes]
MRSDNEYPPYDNYVDPGSEIGVHSTRGSLSVKVITDHAALTRLTNGKNLSSWMIRCLLKLEDLNIEWEYRPGTQNVVADVLSRNPVESERRELKEKGAGLKNDQGERHTSIASNRRPLVRLSPGSWTEPNRRTKKCRKETLGFKRSWQSRSGGPEKKCKKGPKQQGAKRKFSVNNNDLPFFSKRYRRDETVLPNISGYNLRQRRGPKVESRPANEKRTQQGGPVRSRGSREKQQYRPYAEEQRSSSRNTRSRSGQQKHCQERKDGANNNKSLSLEVLVGDVNYKTYKSGWLTLVIAEKQMSFFLGLNC